MKKMILICAVVMSLVVSVFANAQHIESTGHVHHIGTTHMTSQGTHCNGTVGCDCKGFSPIPMAMSGSRLTASTAVTRRVVTSKSEER